MQKFFVLVNGEQQGPFSADQLKGYLAIGQFQPTDLAWHEGLPDWKPLTEFPEFRKNAPIARRITERYRSASSPRRRDGSARTPSSSRCLS